jgi:hypothetical protein
MWDIFDVYDRKLVGTLPCNLVGLGVGASCGLRLVEWLTAGLLRLWRLVAVDELVWADELLLKQFQLIFLVLDCLLGLVMASVLGAHFVLSWRGQGLRGWVVALIKWHFVRASGGFLTVRSILKHSSPFQIEGEVPLNILQAIIYFVKLSWKLRVIGQRHVLILVLVLERWITVRARHGLHLHLLPTERISVESAFAIGSPGPVRHDSVRYLHELSKVVVLVECSLELVWHFIVGKEGRLVRFANAQMGSLFWDFGLLEDHELEGFGLEIGKVYIFYFRASFAVIMRALTLLLKILPVDVTLMEWLLQINATEA